MSIPVHGLAKQTRPNSLQSMQPVVVSSLDSDPLLCPMAYLKEYVLRTSILRKGDQPVASSSIARWIKQILQKSDVDVSQYTAHSTRGTATTTAAKAGISTQEIMERAGWSNQSTFEKFYHRPSQDVCKASTFGAAVLRS